MERHLQGGSKRRTEKMGSKRPIKQGLKTVDDKNGANKRLGPRLMRVGRVSVKIARVETRQGESRLKTTQSNQLIGKGWSSGMKAARKQELCIRVPVVRCLRTENVQSKCREMLKANQT